MRKNFLIKEKTCHVGKNVRAYGFVHLCGNTFIGDNVEIYGDSYIIDSKIENGCKIMSSFIEGSTVKKGCVVGPFAHLRKGNNVEQNVRIGNFVEIKNSNIGKGTKIAHLSYVGDADVGEKVNVGCGVIFVNFNGKIKQRTKVGNGAFIGSNSNLIAPIEIGEKTYICAGTTVTQSTNAGDFVIGRARQIVKAERSKNYLKEE